MDINGILEGGGLVLGGATVVKLLDIAGKWLAARNQRTEVTPQPLVVQGVPTAQTVEACREINGDNKAAHENLFARMSAVEKEVAGIKGQNGMILEALARIENRLNKRRTS